MWTDARPLIHLSKIVTAMTRFTASGLDKNVSNGTSTPQGEQLCHFFLNPRINVKVMDQTNVDKLVHNAHTPN